MGRWDVLAKWDLIGYEFVWKCNTPFHPLVNNQCPGIRHFQRHPCQFYLHSFHDRHEGLHLRMWLWYDPYCWLSVILLYPHNIPSKKNPSLHISILYHMVRTFVYGIRYTWIIPHDFPFHIALSNPPLRKSAGELFDALAGVKAHFVRFGQLIKQKCTDLEYQEISTVWKKTGSISKFLKNPQMMSL